MALPLPDVPPPLAPRRPHVHDAHGEQRPDDWYWLADRSDPEVIAYLEAENAYTDAVLAPTTDSQERLFTDIRSRVVETDVDAPVRRGGWWYWSRTVEGLQYSIFCRRHDPDRLLDAVTVLEEARAGNGAAYDPAADPTVILDENLLAGDSDYFALGVWDVSPDHRLLAYGVDLDGSERYRLRLRDLTTGEDLADEIDGVTYGSAWSADSATLFYVRPDDTMRPFQVWRHTVGTDPAGDVQVYEDPDERYFVSVGTTRSGRYVLVESGSKMTSEVLWLDAGEPGAALRSVLGRVEGVEYDVEHAVWPGTGDTWLVRTNRVDDAEAKDFAVLRMPVGGGPGDLETVLDHRPGVKVNRVDAFAGHVVVTERHDGLEQLRVLRPGEAGGGRLVDQPEAVFSLLGASNPEWDATAYRFGYTSLVTPASTVEVDLGSLARRTVRTQPVRGYDPAAFVTERVWAEADDGTRVPVSVVAAAWVPRDGSAPCLLYGYGSYEIDIDPTFSAARLNLLERGVVFAIAHIRGGGEMGRHWHEEGRLATKTNTFTDFIACAEHLVKTGWVSPERIAIRGGSAGGLLMGAVTNLRPDLWRAVVAEVPFVDVVTTMSDASLPLTVTEWEEWGNPVDDPDAYRVMRSYSPYDNVAAVDHPAMYVTGGLNDPRVGYWEPAKWVARLRAVGTGSRPVVLRTELGAGHQGSSGRYDVWRDEARVQAFVLAALDVEG